MRNIVVLIASLLLWCSWVIGQSAGPAAMPEMLMQEPVPPPDAGVASPNVFFHTQKVGDKVTTGYIAIADSTKPVTGAPYTATAITETTQVLADGNRIVNKTESQLARDRQGRTRRQEMTSNIGPLATNAPKIAFINDPVDKVSYLLDLTDKTAHVIKPPAGAMGFVGPGAHAVMSKPVTSGAGRSRLRRRSSLPAGLIPAAWKSESG